MVKNNNTEVYEDALDTVLKTGKPSDDRTGTGTRRLFGLQYRYDLAAGFPLITSKKVHWKSVVGELCWLLSGSTNVKDLHEYGVTIWDEWADENGELGPIYGKQWRNWRTEETIQLGFGKHVITKHVDQIKWVVDEIRNNPTSRRLVVSAWNPIDLPEMALMPCHTLFQFNVQDGKLSCQLYQRSADMFLGVPFNIASYALLTHMIAHCTGLEVGEFVHTIGDAHVYDSHRIAVEEQLSRTEIPELPKIKLSGDYQYPWEFKPEDIKLIDYKPLGKITAPVAV